jgi:hypothetical protein
MDWAFLAVGGFLLGSVFYTASFTTRYEPEVRSGYLVLGLGVLISVGVNVWLDFGRGVSDWFRGGTLLAYSTATAGLVLIVRERSREHKANE